MCESGLLTAFGDDEKSAQQHPDAIEDVSGDEADGVAVKKESNGDQPIVDNEPAAVCNILYLRKGAKPENLVECSNGAMLVHCRDGICVDAFERRSFTLAGESTDAFSIDTSAAAAGDGELAG